LSYSKSSAGEIPTCIWTLASLRKLYLAGNGFKGNMEKYQLSNLSELNVGFNQLFGTLPAFISGKNFKTFDISSNKFTGVLNADIRSESKDSSLSASVNRLSGKLLLFSTGNFSSVSVLAGNVFIIILYAIIH